MQKCPVRTRIPDNILFGIVSAKKGWKKLKQYKFNV